MNTGILTEPRVAAILGALIADSASLGLHWLYDPERIAQIAQTRGLVFLQPDANDYAGVSGYFAHGGKTAGDASAYGELCLLMLKHLAQHGEFDRVAYQTEYRNHFGPGGAYTGYVDSPTRLTLQKLLPLNPEQFPQISGVDDDQFAALAALPAAIAVHQGSVEALQDKLEKIVRLTNDNATAVAAVRYLGSVLMAVCQGEPVQTALSRCLSHADQIVQEPVADALQVGSLDTLAVAKRFGSACHVLQGVPVIAHILQHAGDYATAIEENIRAGGDSCGRSIMLGAIAAAGTAQQGNPAKGIPLQWVARYRKLTAAADACAALRLYG